MCYRTLYIGSGKFMSTFLMYYYFGACFPCSFTSSTPQLMHPPPPLPEGADMDVCLTNYGHCNYISGKHACIFYDEVCCCWRRVDSAAADLGLTLPLFCVSTQNTKHYELLNYSEHGTTVDNVLYSCDFSEKASPSPPSGLVAKVQGIIRESTVLCFTHFSPNLSKCSYKYKQH